MSAHIQFLRELALEDSNNFDEVENVNAIEEEGVVNKGAVGDEIDEGVETDVPDQDSVNATEMALTIKDATTGNFKIVCSIGSFVVVESIHRGDVYLCTRCYIPYTHMVGPNATHRHGSIHTTTEWQDAPRIFCAACKCDIIGIGVVNSCCICNSVAKKIRPK